MTYDIENSVGYLINVAARLMSQEFDANLNQHGVSIGQWAMLACLWREDGLTISTLSRRTRISEPTAVRTIDRMIRDNLVERSQDENDRRKVCIHLTERGRALRDVLVPCAQQTLSRVLGGVAPEDIEVFVRILRHIISTLDESSHQPVFEESDDPRYRKRLSGCD